MPTSLLSLMWTEQVGVKERMYGLGLKGGKRLDGMKVDNGD